MSKISVMVPCYNEEENVVPMSRALVELFESKLSQYGYEILFIDNHSTDNTRALLRQVCAENKNIKAIFNAKNFGQFRSPYHGMLQATGDCVITCCCDFQDPLELFPEFIKEWESGYKIVIGRKTSSKENGFVYFLRSCYYKTIKKASTVDQIEHFTGFGLYDKAFIEVMRNLGDSQPFLRGIVAELGFERKEIEYTQPMRRAGKTHNNFISLYDAAMLSFTSYTTAGLRVATFIGFIISFLSLVAAVSFTVVKCLYWNSFQLGMAPILVGMFFLGGVQLFVLGFIGEYIISINRRVMNRPLVVEEERLNF